MSIHPYTKLLNQPLKQSAIIMGLVFSVFISPSIAYGNDGYIYTFEDTDSEHTVITSNPNRVPKHYQLIKKESLSQSAYNRKHSTRSAHRHFKAIPSKYDNQIYRLSKKYGVDPHLVKAIIHAESSFNANAVSHKGAQGLMQLMPATAKRFGVKDSFNTEQNIKGGIQYLRVLMKLFRGHIPYVLAAYNAGENNIKKYNGIPPFEETIDYVDKVTALHQKYRNL